MKNRIDVLGKKFAVYQGETIEGIAVVERVDIFYEKQAYCSVRFENEPDRNYLRWIEFRHEIPQGQEARLHQIQKECSIEWASWQRAIAEAVARPSSRDAAMRAYEAGMYYRQTVSFVINQLNKELGYTPDMGLTK